MRSTIAQVCARRSLIVELARADLAVAQHRNRLGWMWWLIDPLVFIGIFWIFKTILLGREAYAPYPMFVGSALIAWRFFSIVVSKNTTVIRSRSSLVRSVAFPLAVLPISVILSEFVFLLIAMVVLLAVAPLFGVPLDWTVVQLPALILLQFIFAGGVGLFVAGLGVVIFDLQSVMSHVLRVIFYMSPAIYGTDLVIERFGAESVWTWLYVHTPFSLFFEGFRAVLWNPSWISAQDWGWIAGESIAALVIGLVVFRWFEGDAAKMTH